VCQEILKHNKFLEGEQNDSKLKQPTSKVRVNGRKSKTVQPPMKKKFIVVFDIFGVISVKNTSNEKGYDEIPWKKFDVECPRIPWRGDFIVCLPYLQILFEYLLEQGARIVFLSAGIKERNVAVISGLLTSFWGCEKYEGMKSKGQFYIFSKEDMREGNRSANEVSDWVKDLRKVIREGESLSDIILVDDCHSYQAHDQRLFIGVTNLYGESRNPCPVNNVYYLLGIFKRYFEDKKCKKLSLRDGLARILCFMKTDAPYNLLAKEDHPWTRKTIDIGFSVVREQFPNAAVHRKERFIISVKGKRKG